MSKQPQQQQKELKVFNNQYVVKKKLSSGSFGVVFLGEDKLTGQEVALKIEKEEKGGENCSIEREAILLTKLQGINGIPKFYWNGQEGAYNVMVIQLLGKDLSHYTKQFTRLSLKTVILLAQQLIQTLEEVHNKSVIHRDMKPENILVGRNNQIQQIYLIDFGISKSYRDSHGNHIPMKVGKPFIGTTRYASIGAHKGNELGRSDDLESLAYVLIFLFQGQLPWQNLQNVSDKDKCKVVGDMKVSIDPNVLCKDMPVEFARFLEYTKKTKFSDKPDYKYLQSLFVKAAQANNILFDNKYDWCDLEKKQQQETQAKTASKQEQSRKQSIDSKQPVKNNQKNPEKIESRKSSSKLNPELPQFGNSQFDFLKPPDPYAKGRKLIQRSQEKRKSAASQISNNTYQSSIANCYQPSQGSYLAVEPKHKTVQVQRKNKQLEIEQSMLDFTQSQFQPPDLDAEGTILSSPNSDQGLFCKYTELLKTQVLAYNYQNLYNVQAFQSKKLTQQNRQTIQNSDQ